MLVGDKHYRTVWLEGSTVRLIDQLKLPHQFSIYDCKDYKQTADAIKTMIVRGAGAIGATGGYGIAQAALQAPDQDFHDFMRQTADELRQTRPTAQNLFYAIGRAMNKIKNLEPARARQEAVKEAQAVADEDANACKRIGEIGANLIENGYRISTHCSAGFLAFVDWGSALSPVYQAKRQGKDVFVYVNETRPRGQGASLTSWELLNEGIRHVIIPDNATGFLMQRKEIDMVIVGADRVCGGDSAVANKIGTYEKAVCAKENGIPFYVAIPTSTIDWNCQSGDNIPIEERHEDEVLFVWGRNDRGEIDRVRIAPDGAKAKNLAFDITPSRFITAFITEKGIFKPDELHKLRPD